jgi:hypothetical protein
MITSIVSDHLRTRARCAYIDTFGNVDIGGRGIWEQ